MGRKFVTNGPNFLSFMIRTVFLLSTQAQTFAAGIRQVVVLTFF